MTTGDYRNRLSLEFCVVACAVCVCIRHSNAFKNQKSSEALTQDIANPSTLLPVRSRWALSKRLPWWWWDSREPQVVVVELEKHDVVVNGWEGFPPGESAVVGGSRPL